jgi:hypothetical protein
MFYKKEYFFNFHKKNSPVGPVKIALVNGSPGGVWWMVRMGR